MKAECCSHPFPLQPWNTAPADVRLLLLSPSRPDQTLWNPEQPARLKEALTELSTPAVQTPSAGVLLEISLLQIKKLQQRVCLYNQLMCHLSGKEGLH